MAQSSGLFRTVMIGWGTRQAQQQQDLVINKIAGAEAAVSVNEQDWSVMHVHVQLRTWLVLR
jgi:hypothetical protein